MANQMNTVEYKVKVTRVGDHYGKARFAFYLAQPYSKRGYRFIQVINAGPDADNRHFFFVILGNSRSCVNEMSKQIFNDLGNIEAVATKRIATIYYNNSTTNIGSASFADVDFTSSYDIAALVGEYKETEHVSVSNSSDNDTVCLWFDVANKNGGEAPKKPDIVKVPQPDEIVIDIDPSEYARCLAENWRLKDIETRYDSLFKDFGDKDCENHTLREQIKVATMLAEKWKQQYIELGIRVMMDKFKGMDDDLLCKEIRELVERYRP